MQPALSVIFFTVVSGCGYGLWFALGIVVAVEPRLVGAREALALIALGALFAAAGLVASTLHLGKPLRAWRAFSQWRSSWLSREGIASLAAFAPAIALAAAQWLDGSAASVRASGLALAVLSVLTVYCTARIYTTLKPIPAWRDAYVLPGYLLFALLGGAVWTAAVDALGAAREDFVRADIAVAAALLGAAAALLKREYWQRVDAPRLPSTGAATGLERFGTVRAAEAPHTEANYLTREMGFVLARKHAATLRVIAIVLFAAVPLLAAMVALFAPAGVNAGVALACALATTAGLLVERWLFFAQARHVVMSYYDEQR